MIDRSRDVRTFGLFGSVQGNVSGVANVESPELSECPERLERPATPASVLPTDYARARRVLARRDPVIRDLMRRHGSCGLAGAQHTDPFTALVHAIISQQLSTKAAATIAGALRRAVRAWITPTPSASRRLPDEQLRAVGLSGQKLGYLRDLCAAHRSTGTLLARGARRA